MLLRYKVLMRSSPTTIFWEFWAVAMRESGGASQAVSASCRVIHGKLCFVYGAGLQLTRIPSNALVCTDMPWSVPGIAVGIATKIPPHNLREVVAGLRALIADPDIS